MLQGAIGESQWLKGAEEYEAPRCKRNKSQPRAEGRLWACAADKVCDHHSSNRGRERKRESQRGKKLHPRAPGHDQRRECDRPLRNRRSWADHREGKPEERKAESRQRI
jgi:hypothetical protein